MLIVHTEMLEMGAEFHSLCQHLSQQQIAQLGTFLTIMQNKGNTRSRDETRLCCELISLVDCVAALKTGVGAYDMDHDC